MQIIVLWLRISSKASNCCSPLQRSSWLLGDILSFIRCAYLFPRWNICHAIIIAPYVVILLTSTRQPPIHHHQHQPILLPSIPITQPITNSPTPTCYFSDYPTVVAAILHWQSFSMCHLAVSTCEIEGSEATAGREPCHLTFSGSVGVLYLDGLSFVYRCRRFGSTALTEIGWGTCADKRLCCRFSNQLII